LRDIFGEPKTSQRNSSLHQRHERFICHLSAKISQPFNFVAASSESRKLIHAVM